LPIDRHLKGRYHRDVNTNRENRDLGVAALADEAWKPAAELGLLLIDPVFWGFGLRRGDGRPVLVLPGLYGGDRYLGPLRDWLRRIGYGPVPSGLDRNPGWSEPLVTKCDGCASQRAEESGFGRSPREPLRPASSSSRFRADRFGNRKH
jgi:hypothetical protein